jgi:ABC-type uncharacterized transport system permease subunit
MIRFDDIHEQGNPFMSLIHIQNLSKQFKILNRREGLSGAFRALFSPIVGLGLFALTYWIWTKGVNNYTGTGS